MANPEHVAILRKGVKVWNRWRDRYPTIRPDLSRASLSSRNLTNVDLRYTNLSYATLNKVILKSASISYSNLSFASLSEAILTDVSLSESILTGVSFLYAYLTELQLYNANLKEAVVGSTVFGDIDFRTARCLESVVHVSPSTIGIDTIYKSGGQIPDAFLRGCGVPENFITFAHSLVNSAIEFYSCFISYSHADKSFARRLHDQLQARGIRCWLDEHQLLPGHDIYDEVDRGIRLWDKVLLCCSKDSLSSWWVDKEISGAFDKEQALWKERNKKTLALIPLNLDGYLLSDEWQDGKAIPIKTRLAADFTGWESDNAKFEREFERLVKALRADGGDREAPPSPKL